MHKLPSVKLQTTFLQLLNPSVIILALLLSDSRIPLLYVLQVIENCHSLLKKITTLMPRWTSQFHNPKISCAFNFLVLCTD